MSTRITIITEIKKDNKWEYVPEVPQTFKTNCFDVLGDVLNRWKRTSFPVKGLPEDMSAKKFGFISNRDTLMKVYKEAINPYFICTVIADEKVIMSPYSVKGKFSIDCFISVDKNTYESIKLNLEKEGDNYIKSRYCCPHINVAGGNKAYMVFDADKAIGHIEWLTYDKIYGSFEEYLQKECEEDWDEDAQDYGEWDKDFTREELYNHSYITLKEFMKWDDTEYRKIGFRLERAFYDTFVNAGGVFPDIFEIDETGVEPCSIVETIREAAMPSVLVKWPVPENEYKEYPMYKGIQELKKIAYKYYIDNPEDIRIIFAFD